MLDFGPRAMASFCPTVTTSNSGFSEAAQEAPCDDSSPPAVWPPHDYVMAAQWLHLPPEQSSSGAGSSTSSTSGAGPIPCIVSDIDRVPPALLTMLQSAVAISP